MTRLSALEVQLGTWAVAQTEPQGLKLGIHEGMI